MIVFIYHFIIHLFLTGKLNPTNDQLPTLVASYTISWLERRTGFARSRVQNKIFQASIAKIAVIPARIITYLISHPQFNL